ncbi:hypothetical protein PH344_25535, partial [Escherichia coli]
WEGWAILLRQKQKKLIMLPSETMIWQPEFTDKTLSRKPGAVHCGKPCLSSYDSHGLWPGFFLSNTDVMRRKTCSKTGDYPIR